MALRLDRHSLPTSPDDLCYVRVMGSDDEIDQLFEMMADTRTEAACGRPGVGLRPHRLRMCTTSLVADLAGAVLQAARLEGPPRPPRRQGT